MRGDIHSFTAGSTRRGHEQRGTRFCVLVQSDDYERSTVIVVPTSQSARQGLVRPVIQIGGEATLALIEQMGAVDRSRLGPFQGRVSRDELERLEQAMRDVLDL